MANAPRPNAAYGLKALAKDAAGVILLLTVLIALGLRLSSIVHVPGEPEQSDAAGRNGLTDFRDVIYYPLRAVRDGVNPYDCDTTTGLPTGEPRYRQRYPVFNIFPLYSPLVLILFAPLSSFDFSTSAAMFVIFNVVLVLLLAYVSWRCIGQRPGVAAVTTLASIIFVTNAGRSNFLGGETAVPLALATTAAAFYCGRNSTFSGLALGLASFKPTIGLPLGIALLLRRDWRGVVFGWGIGLVVGVAGLVAIFYRSGDLARMPEVLVHNQHVVESEHHVDPRFSAARIDAAGSIECLIPLGRSMQLIASLSLLGLAGGSLWLIARQNSLEAAETSRTITCLATVATMYHSGYDGLLLWPVILSLACAAPAYWQSAPRWFRPALLMCLLIPMINILPTKIFVSTLAKLDIGPATIPAPWPSIGWTFACTVSGLSLLTALVLLAWHSWRLRGAGKAA